VEDWEVTPGTRVLIGKSTSLRGTVVSSKGNLVDVIIDGHKKPSTFIESSLSLVPTEKPRRRPRKQVAQQTLEITPFDVWRDKFIAQYGANTHVDVLDLLGRRHANPRQKTLIPGTPPFDYERFCGFGQFLVWLETQPRPSTVLCDSAALHT
jgi:hypothetical protein